MKKAFVFLCFVFLLALLVAAQTLRTNQNASRTYPDFALQPPTINTNPGPEYASWTRMYQGIPGIERTAKGRLWAGWTAGGVDEGPMNYVVLVTSTDDGKTWSGPKLVIQPERIVWAFGPGLWYDPRGHLWLFWMQSTGHHDGRGGVWAIVSNDPDSERPEWSKPQRLADGEAINKPTVLRSGDWLLPIAVPPFECELPDVNQEYKLGLTPSIIKQECHDPGEGSNNVYIAADSGNTWKLLGRARIQDGQLEPMIVERRDKSLWMLVRTEYGIGQAISRDGGKSWGESGPSGIRNAVSRFFIRRLNSGKLLIVRHNPPDIWTRSLLTAYLSDDDGKTWYGGLVLDERKDVSYPDGVEAEDGKIYVIYDRGRTTDREILIATFMEEDVKQGKCVTDQCQLKRIVNKAGE
ncbi:MAG TPA: sialidase family protein [Candidatus Acidoferrales bacterium]|nr:sialidase family protein [Candidatus Acidoferrales bacterium]